MPKLWFPFWIIFQNKPEYQALSQFFRNSVHFIIILLAISLLACTFSSPTLLTNNFFRYILIAWPHMYQKIYTKLNVALIIGLIWAFSYGLQIPTLLGKWGVYGMDEKLGTCSIKKDDQGRSSKTALFVIGFALPCIIIVICYAQIYLVVRMSHKRLQQHSTGNKYKRSEMKITKMVLVIFVCFLVCYLPITVVKIFDADVNHAPLHVVGYLLIYLSSCVNPVVYVTMNKQYRVAYLETLRCKYNSNLDSQQTQPPQSKTNNLSVTYLKNMVSNSPKV